MLLIMLGVLDLLSALMLLLLSFGVVFKSLIIASAVYLGIKGIIFLGDFASILDFVAALLLVISLAVALPKFILIIFAVILVQKAFFSFIS